MAPSCCAPVRLAFSSQNRRGGFLALRPLLRVSRLRRRVCRSGILRGIHEALVVATSAVILELMTFADSEPARLARGLVLGHPAIDVSGVLKDSVREPELDLRYRRL